MVEIGGAQVLTAVATWVAVGVAAASACVATVASCRWRQRARSLATLAEVDPLTGLANRRVLDRAGTAGGASWWVAYLDVDRFKCVNDLHGHAAGDVLLQVVATLLRASVRPGDVAARVGGDEFVLVLADCSGAEALDVVRRVQRGLSSAVHGCTLSVGLCGPVPAGRAVDAGVGRGVAPAVAAADLALGEAKRLGRGRVVVAGGLSPAVGSGAVRDLRR